MTRWRTAAVALFFLLPGGLSAQGRAISGTVRDEAGIPIPAVQVILDLDHQPARDTRTDDAGHYVFRDVERGIHKLRYMRLGYYPQDYATAVRDTAVRLDVVLRRLPSSLDTVRVHGLRVGVVGLVVAHQSQRPVDSAEVTVVRSDARAITGRNGQFALVDGVDAGPQLVLAKKGGYETKLLDVTVPESSTVEVAMLLDRPSGNNVNRRAMAYEDLEDRARWIGGRSALVTGAELAKTGEKDLYDALWLSRVLQRKNLNQGYGCILVDGWQLGGGDFDVSQVEAVEVYAPGTDYTGSLAWRGCEDTWVFAPLTARDKKTVAPRANRPGLPTLVIWLKR
jgi:hypothetical protein